MPNWCNNTVEITHKDPAMLERARNAFNEGRFLSEFVPVPKELQIVAGRVGDDNDQAQKDLETQEQINLTAYGYKNWYDYCVNEWGTKWDVGGDGNEALDRGTDFGPGLILNFDSAWSPPIQAYEKMCDLGFSIRAYYYEGGMNFAGIWEDGCDEFYDLPSTSQAVREEIPEVLDDMFAISESMEMYEQENQEEEDEN